MNYKEKYEMALEGIQEILGSGEDSIKMSRLQLRLQGIFPELKESEDEKIRKALIKYYSFDKDGGSHALDNITPKQIVAWLEKQGKKDEEILVLKDQIESLHAAIKTIKETHRIELEKQGEQKPITFNDAHIIDSALNNYCCKQYSALHKENGGVLSFARLQHLAMDIYGWCKKQGEQKPIIEMKSAEESLGIDSETYNKIVDERIYGDDKSTWGKQGGQKPADKIEPKFKVGEWITNGDYTWKIVEVKPLDYILQAQDGNIVDDTIFHVDEQFHSFTIADAKDGDVLDANGAPFIYKKHDKDYVYFYCGVNLAGEFIEANGIDTWNINCKVYPATKEQREQLKKAMADAGYTFDFEKKELKKIEMNPAWSEEDEKIYQSIMDDTVQENQLNDKQTNWLRDIKHRYFPQPKQEWSEEDEECLENAIMYW